VPTGAGNYADSSAESILSRTVAGYDDGYTATAPAGAFQPSVRGLFNMGGNVAEWVQDLYAVVPPASGLLTDPVGPDSGKYHVIRGASYMASTVTELRLSYRDYGTGARPDVGFRIARHAE
jgi:formylglycine-generating enzyme required for sulfatase activity